MPRGAKSVRRACSSIGSPVTFSTTRCSWKIASPEYPNSRARREEDRQRPVPLLAPLSPVRKTARVRQDHSRRDPEALLLEGNGRRRHVLRQRAVEVDLPLLHELEDREGEDRFRHRGGLEERLAGDGRRRSARRPRPTISSRRPSGPARGRSTPRGRGARPSGAASASRSSRPSTPRRARGPTPKGRSARAPARRPAGRPRPRREAPRAARERPRTPRRRRRRARSPRTSGRSPSGPRARERAPARPGVASRPSFPSAMAAPCRTLSRGSPSAAERAGTLSAPIPASASAAAPATNGSASASVLDEGCDFPVRRALCEGAAAGEGRENDDRNEGRQPGRDGLHSSPWPEPPAAASGAPPASGARRGTFVTGAVP